MENLDKGLKVPKWGLINILNLNAHKNYLPKLSAQAQKFAILILASVVRELTQVK